MSIPRLAFVLWCGTLWLFEGAASAQQTSKEGLLPSVVDWRHDIDEIVKDIRLLHPDPFTRIGRFTFLREVSALKAALPYLTEEQRAVQAMRLVASLGDGHTQLVSENPIFAYWYPIRLYEFTDGLFVTSAYKSVADLAGAQVLEIGGRPAIEVIERARRLMGADNEFGSKERLYAVHNAGLMKGLGYADSTGALTVKFRPRSGRTVARTLNPTKGDDAAFEWQYRTEVYGLPFGADSEWVSAYKGLPASAFNSTDTSRPPHLTDRLHYGSRPLPFQGAYYVRTDYVTDYDFVQFFQRVLREVDQLRPRRLILDWRYNFGGDGSKLAFMIEEFIKRADARPWQELYILTGRKTFSAGIMAVDAFLKHTPHTIVGEPAGGPLNHFGDPTSRSYPRTGLGLKVSTMWHQLSSSDDVSEFIPVDIPAPFSFADYAAGRDPAVDPILRGEEVRSIPVIALSDGGAAARRVYAERQSRFAKYDWWTPPQEIDLRGVCDALREQKRMTDALETCKLNAEIHPFTWNVWLNLGIAQRAAGLKKEGLASYRCVLVVDPNNFNGADIRRLLAREDSTEATGIAPGCPGGR